MSAFGGDEDFEDIELDLPEDIDEQLQAKLRAGYIADLEERLAGLGDILEALLVSEDQTDLINQLKGEVHSMKGEGSSFGFPGISRIAHLWEDYLKSKSTLSSFNISELYIYIDRIKDLTQREKQPDHIELSRIVKSLPNSFSAEDVILEKEDVHILTVLPDNLQRKVIEDEINACGFNITPVHASLEALELAIRIQPHVIICSMVIDNIDGLELIGMIRTLKITKHIPCILLTSDKFDLSKATHMPEDMKIVKKGSGFSDQLSEAIIDLGIMH